MIVLAVDDNADNLTALRAVLGERLPEAKLLTALDGQRGLALAKAEDPDVILLDIIMPGMDGFAVCRKLKNDEALRSTPVLFLTALRTDRDSRVKALEAGAEGFLTKPFDELELVAQIRAMVKIKAAAAIQRMAKDRLSALVAERTAKLEQSQADMLALLEALKVENAARKRSEQEARDRSDELASSRTELKAIYDHSPVMMCVVDEGRRIHYANAAFAQYTGIPVDELVSGRACGVFGCVNAGEHPSGCGFGPSCQKCTLLRAMEVTFATGEGRHNVEYRTTFERGSERRDVTLLGSTALIVTSGDKRLLLCLYDITERKRLELALEKRLMALSQPLDQPEGVTFEDLFDPADIQRAQDDFARATGVSSIITRPDGTPITQPSNFCRLCSEIVRRTGYGQAACRQIDSQMGAVDRNGPRVCACPLTGLLSAGTIISVGNRHIANWLIGQVRDGAHGEGQLLEFARRFGLDEREVLGAYREVPVMSLERFGMVAQALYSLASQLSTTAYQNVQQARFIRERRQAEDALRSSEESYRALFREMIDGFALCEVLCDAGGRPEDYRFLAVNPAYERLSGLGADQLVGRTARDVWPDSASRWIEAYSAVALTGVPVSFEDDVVGPGRHCEIKVFCPRHGQFACIFTETTERRAAQEERARLEAQLRQAQKMESVGRLAGGVAHDFNNMLGVILGNTEMVLEQLPSDSPLAADLGEVVKAAERSADLTRQLLAFARKQTVTPKPLNLCEVVDDTLKMLKRLIGEDIELIWRPEQDLWLVYVDPTQIDQILANLCVNARDAIRDVGRITISVANCVVDADCCDAQDECVAGEYVLLSVSDNGQGMDIETQSHLFEPFFTTKGVGRGTGLGLATVYGIVRQNNGCIRVKSAAGCGTTLNVYLPRYAGSAELARADVKREPAKRGSETILLVEDEPAMLKLILRVVEQLGYTVLAARSPSEAIRLAKEYDGPIHLLMSDMVMPEMNGRDLAVRLLGIRPSMKRLFMSGYTSDAIAQRGVLDEGVYVIQKPISMGDLAARVREAIDGS